MSRARLVHHVEADDARRLGRERDEQVWKRPPLAARAEKRGAWQCFRAARVQMRQNEAKNRAFAAKLVAVAENKAASASDKEGEFNAAAAATERRLAQLRKTHEAKLAAQREREADHLALVTSRARTSDTVALYAAGCSAEHGTPAYSSGWLVFIAARTALLSAPEKT